MTENETALKLTYRYYAWLAPGTQEPSVWCGDIEGPNVHRVRNWRFVWQARLHAWWLNRNRPTPRECGTPEHLIGPENIAANRGGDRMDTWADVG